MGTPNLESYRQSGIFDGACNWPDGLPVPDAAGLSEELAASGESVEICGQAKRDGLPPADALAGYIDGLSVGAACRERLTDKTQAFRIVCDSGGSVWAVAALEMSDGRGLPCGTFTLYRLPLADADSVDFESAPPFTIADGMRMAQAEIARACDALRG